MALPIYALAALAAVAFYAFAKDESTGGGGSSSAYGPPLPVGGPDDWYSIAPNGVIVAKKERLPFILSSLSNKGVTAAPQSNAPANTVAIGNAGAMPALQWVAAQNAAGRLVLASLHPSRGLLASVAPGEELTWASSQRREWAVIAEPATNAQAGQFPFPGGGVPGAPTIPAGQVPGNPNQGPVVEIPGFGSVPIPGGGVPGFPGFPGAPGFPPGVPGVPSVPGATTWPATHLFTVRSGDIPSKVAQHYTGNFLRARELLPLNNMTEVGSGAQTYFTPWAPGQVVKLPLDWNVAKGLPPVQRSKKVNAADIAKLAKLKGLKGIVLAGDEEAEAEAATLRALKGAK